MNLIKFLGNKANDISSDEAINLFIDNVISTQQLFEIACERVKLFRRFKPEVFVPLYISNYCDSSCKMCGMNIHNKSFDRKDISKNKIIEQLNIIYHHERVSSLGILTGEYLSSQLRELYLFKVGWTIEQAFKIGFQRIFLNIGSLSIKEIEILKEWVGIDNRIILCVFQETYDLKSYNDLIAGELSPKGDFAKRAKSLLYWLEAGFSKVNVGVLLGLGDPKSELKAIIAHVSLLKSKGAEVAISVPRIRKTITMQDFQGSSDEIFIRFICILAIAFPREKIVLTTRENFETLEKLLPLIGVISPGSSDVAPYVQKGKTIRNDIRSSQFFINKKRERPRIILDRLCKNNNTVLRFFDCK